MNSTTATLSPTQRAWITTLATTITLLIVILLGAAPCPAWGGSFVAS
jgi:hypothetical protein